MKKKRYIKKLVDYFSFNQKITVGKTLAKFMNIPTYPTRMEKIRIAVRSCWYWWGG